jgi:hypothetical protein
MRKWKMTLDERTRAELGEPTRRERVQMEIEKERSRRTKWEMKTAEIERLLASSSDHAQTGPSDDASEGTKAGM